MITKKGWLQALMFSLFKKEAAYNADVVMSDANACSMKGFEVTQEFPDNPVSDRDEVTGTEHGTEQEIIEKRVNLTYSEPKAKPNSLIGLAALVLGSVTPTKDGDNDAYSHRIIPVPVGMALPSINAEFLKGGIQYKYKGLKGNTLKISGEAGGLVSLEATLLGSGSRESAEELKAGASYTTAGDEDTVLRSGTTNALKLGAKFTQDGTRQIKKVILQLKKNGTITEGKKVFVEIFADTAGSPSGAALATSETVLCSALGTSYGDAEFEFETAFEVSDATTYHIVLCGDYDASAENNVTWSTKGSIGAGAGNLNTLNDTTWTPDTTKSAMFEISQQNFTAFAAVIAESWLRVNQMKIFFESGASIDVDASFTQGAQNISSGAGNSLDVRFKSFDFNWNNNLEEQPGAGGEGILQDADYGRRSSELTMTLLFGSQEDLDLYLNQTTVAVEFDLAGAEIDGSGSKKFGFHIVIPKLKLTAAPLPQGGPADTLTCDFAMSVFDDGVNPAVILEGYNAVPEYLA